MKKEIPSQSEFQNLLGKERLEAWNAVYVRKSIGNALRDISKTHTGLVKSELDTWDLSSKQIKQVYRLAAAWMLQQC